MDFFEVTNVHLPELNENERKIFDYIVHNMGSVSGMNIRELAQNCYVSTTTIVRFSKKLGFQGYREFTDSIRFTLHNMDKTELPDVLWKREYSEEYIKNIIESIRVISQEKIDRFRAALKSGTSIYFYGSGLNREAAHYAYRVFTAIGYCTYFPEEEYEIKSMLTHMKNEDILFLFSITGEDTDVINIVESANIKCKPFVTSITWSGNNVLQNISDLDFYIFADQLQFNGINLTSRISMIAIVEMLAYSLIAKRK